MQQASHETYLRLSQIVGRPASKTNPAKYPAVAGILPISASSWWKGVKAGRYPQPVKLGPKITAWRASEVLAVANAGGAA